jgi:hypothetical protein
MPAQEPSPAAAPSEKPGAQQREVARVEVFRGVKKSEETFDLPTGKK